VGPAAFAVEVAWAGGWEGAAEKVCQSGVAFELRQGLRVADVEDLRSQI